MDDDKEPLTEARILIELLERLKRAQETAERYGEKFSILTINTAVEIATRQLQTMMAIEDMEEIIRRIKERTGTRH